MKGTTKLIIAFVLIVLHILNNEVLSLMILAVVTAYPVIRLLQLAGEMKSAPDAAAKRPGRGRSV